MEKKLIVKFGLFITLFIFILTMGTSLEVSTENGLTREQAYDSLNKLNWSEHNKQFINGSDNIIVDITYKVIDTIGYITFSITKAVVDYGLNDPQVDFSMIFLLFTLFIVAGFIVPIIKVVIIIVIFIRDYISTKKEKKEIERLKEGVKENDL